MKKALLLIAIVLCGGSVGFAQTVDRGWLGGMLAFDVTDERKVITRDMGKGLLLRVVKERSVSQEHYGWRVEVVRKP